LPRVSVVLPCRDAAAHVTEAAASLAAQTFRDYEVIAVDDGSTDGTADLLDAWSDRDRRVRVLHTPPRGLVPALAAALDLAGGEIIARMDGDDIAQPERLARQVEWLDRDRELAACGTRVRYFPREAVRGGALRYERWLNGLTRPAELERDLFVECPVAHPTLAIRRTALDAAGGYRDPGWPEDYDLVLRLWLRGSAIANVPEPLLAWREGAHRLSRNDARYSEAAFRRCKVHYLGRGFLSRIAGVVVWGAGPVGKGFARELLAQGHALRAFVDLDPRKIGQTVYDAPVIEPGGLAAFPDAFVVAAVGSASARAEIRTAFADAGRVEMRDCCAVA
jgi:glycosyltransferase involved in cell wall biosynthesis